MKGKPSDPARVRRNKQHFHIRLRMLGYSSYADYLRSEHWTEVKRWYRAAHPWECGHPSCERTTHLQLHHRTYENLGVEQAFLWQLMPLCPKHHKAVHKFSRRREATVEKATRVVLSRGRRKRRAPKFSESKLLETVEKLLDGTHPRTDADAIDRRGVVTGQSAENTSERVT